MEKKKEGGKKKTFINDPYAHLSTFTFRHDAAAAAAVAAAATVPPPPLRFTRT